VEGFENFRESVAYFDFTPFLHFFFIKLHKNISFTVYRDHKKTNLGQNIKTTRQKSSIIHQLFCDFLIPEAFQFHFQIQINKIKSGPQNRLNITSAEQIVTKSHFKTRQILFLCLFELQQVFHFQ
jgi:hypothetical protein